MTPSHNLQVGLFRDKSFSQGGGTMKNPCVARPIDEIIAKTKKLLLYKEKTKRAANKANKESEGVREREREKYRKRNKKIKAEQNEPREEMPTEINQLVHNFKLRFSRATNQRGFRN